MSWTTSDAVGLRASSTYDKWSDMTTGSISVVNNLDVDICHWSATFSEGPSIAFVPEYCYKIEGRLDI